MKLRSFAVATWLAVEALLLRPAVAIESILLAEVQRLPAALHRTFPCGRWSVGGAEGYYRVVIASVYGGVGSEMYVQRIAQTAGGQPELTLVETVAFPELNNDHNQYSVSAATCRGSTRSSFAELTAENEHDIGNVQRIIRIELKPPYRVTNRRVPSP